jgi:hypothetical protein
MARVPKQPWSDLDSEEIDFLRKLHLSSGFTPCPPPDLLRSFRADVVPQDVKDLVQQHVQNCRVCQILADDLEEIEAPISSEERRRIRDRVFNEVRHRGWSPSWRWVWAVIPVSAVAAIILLFVWNRFPTQNSVHNNASAISSVTPSVFALKPPKVGAPIPLVMRGTSEGTYLSELMRALEPYRAGNYEQAATSLNALAQKYPRSAEVAFYSGASLLMEGKNSEAADRLKRGAALADGRLAGECRWYLAIAEIRSNDADEAVAPLRDLCDMPGEYQARACAGINELASSRQSSPPR